VFDLGKALRGSKVFLVKATSHTAPGMTLWVIFASSSMTQASVYRISFLGLSSVLQIIRLASKILLGTNTTLLFPFDAMARH
jgi:hypothetical protein